MSQTSILKLEKVTMSQTYVLILIAILAITSAFGIAHLAKIGYLEKGVEMRQAQESKEAARLPVNGKEALQDVK